jgi:hypothetical protein
MNGDNTSVHEIPKAPEQPQANLQAPDLQRGSQPMEAAKSGNSDLGKMGFPDTQIAGMDAKDKNFNTADAMSKKGGAGKGTTPDGAPDLAPYQSGPGADGPGNHGDPSMASHAGAAHGHPGDSGMANGKAGGSSISHGEGSLALGSGAQPQDGQKPQGGQKNSDVQSTQAGSENPTTRGLGPNGQDNAATRGMGQPGDNKQGDNRQGDRNQENPDLPYTREVKNNDGSSTSAVADNSHNSFTQISKDKDGNVTRIDRQGDNQKDVSTSYNKDGKAISETDRGNGTRTWDSDGKQTSDTRQDKSNLNRPEDLTKQQNADGTTSVTAGPGDGSSTKYTFDKDGNIKQEQQDNGNGTKTTDDFYKNGNLQKHDITSYDRNNGNTLSDHSTEFNKAGDFTKEQYDDNNGNHQLVQKDDDGNLVKMEDKRPGQGIDRSEEWYGGNYDPSKH